MKKQLLSILLIGGLLSLHSAAGFMPMSSSDYFASSFSGLTNSGLSATIRGIRLKTSKYIVNPACTLGRETYCFGKDAAGLVSKGAEGSFKIAKLLGSTLVETGKIGLETGKFIEKHPRPFVILLGGLVGYNYLYKPLTEWWSPKPKTNGQVVVNNIINLKQ